jgi:hypothetical protein
MNLFDLRTDLKDLRGTVKLLSTDELRFFLNVLETITAVAQRELLRRERKAPDFEVQCLRDRGEI